ncbi:hypothetical protein CONPUDRAFT_67519, partial [Coniophora puteana RWD-64-598 SS2]
FLKELIRHDGRGDFKDSLTCHWCSGANPAFRCEDCLMGAMGCRECMVKNHTTSPFHRIKYWNGKYFERSSLNRLGLRIQLGHSPGRTCVNPVCSFDDDFVVMDSHGIHEVGLDYCGCETAASKYRQLLRARLFPATVTEPKTAATFRLLEEFQLLSLESKASAYEAYHALARRSDNAGLVSIKVSNGYLANSFNRSSLLTFSL